MVHATRCVRHAAHEVNKAVDTHTKKKMEELGVGSRKRGRERATSVGADRGYPENINNKEAERKAQGAEGLDRYRRENVSPSWRLINGRNKHY